MEADTTQTQLLEFVQREYLAQQSEMLKKYDLSVEKRVQKGICITDITYLYEQLSGALVYSFESKSHVNLNDGDLVVLNRGKPHGELVANGVLMWLKSINYDTKSLTLEHADYCTSQRFATDVTLSLTLDRACSDLQARYLSQAIRNTFEGPTDVQELILGKQIHRLTRTKYSSQSAVSCKPDLLTSQQNIAYERSASNQLTLIQGPPGSGKTKLLAQIVLQAFRQKKSVLLTAFTHAAIDNLLAAVIKLMPEHRDNIFKVSGQKQFNAQTEISQIACEQRDLAAILDVPVIIGATVFQAHKMHSFEIENFDLLIIDEASQMTIPHALAPMLIADKYILAGDHKQLPPIIIAPNFQTKESQSLETSIFQHLLALYPEVNVELDVTFRMNQELNEFPSREFYFGRLRSAEVNAQRKFTTSHNERDLHHIICRNESATFVEVAHSTCTNTSALEANAAAQLAYRLIVGHGLSPLDIAIITPFNKHKNDIANRLRKLFQSNANWAPERTVRQIAIETVEKIQGQEREVAIVSFCSSKASYLREAQEFIYKPNRLNVAITRAKSRLFIIASAHFFPCINNIQIDAEYARVYDEYYKYLCKRRVPFERADIIPEIPQAQEEKAKTGLSTVA